LHEKEIETTKGEKGDFSLRKKRRREKRGEILSPTFWGKGEGKVQG